MLLPLEGEVGWGWCPRFLPQFIRLAGSEARNIPSVRAGKAFVNEGRFSETSSPVSFPSESATISHSIGRTRKETS